MSAESRRSFWREAFTLQGSSTPLVFSQVIVVGLIAAEDPERAVLPHAVVPIYVRRPDAELARSRKMTRA